MPWELNRLDCRHINLARHGGGSKIMGVSKLINFVCYIQCTSTHIYTIKLNYEAMKLLTQQNVCLSGIVVYCLIRGIFVAANTFLHFS